MMDRKDMVNVFQKDFSSLEELVDLISEVIHCPVTLEDANHRLLAYSTHDDQTDPARISTIIGRRVPEKVINSLWKEGVIPALLTSDQPIRVNAINDVGLRNRVAISIRKNDEVLGYIWALEANGPLADNDFTQLENASKAAKNLLLKLQVKRNKFEAGYQEFFRKLLTGHVLSENEAKQNFSNLGVLPPERFAVVVFSFKQTIDEGLEKQINYILTTTQRLRVVFHRIDEHELIVLTAPKQQETTNELDAFIHTFIKQMAERFNIHDIAAVSGASYNQFSDVKSSYHQALIVLKMKAAFKDELKSIKSYSSLGIYQFLDFLAEPHQQIPFNHSVIEKLKKYDEENHSHLLTTLEIYLNNDSNVTDAAKELHIHVNTLNYRLKRISEIGGINLKDFNQKAFIYIVLKLRTFCEI
jgi:DNA-binding PucR family transcriptional regulator